MSQIDNSQVSFIFIIKYTESNTTEIPLIFRELSSQFNAARTPSSSWKTSHGKSQRTSARLQAKKHKEFDDE